MDDKKMASVIATMLAEKIQEACEVMMQLPVPLFFATICSMIDMYADEQGWSNEVLEEHLEMMAETMKEVHGK